MKINRILIYLILSGLIFLSLWSLGHRFVQIAQSNTRPSNPEGFALNAPIGGYTAPGSVLVANGDTYTPNSELIAEICHDYGVMCEEDEERTFWR